MLNEIRVDGQLGTPVMPMVKEDEQSFVELAIDEEQIDAQAANNAIVLLVTSPLQVYLDGTYNIARLPRHVGGRLVGLPRRVIYDDWASETS